MTIDVKARNKTVGKGQKLIRVIAHYGQKYELSYQNANKHAKNYEFYLSAELYQRSCITID